jgi:hypothetical protein
MTKFGTELIQSAREALAIAKGEMKPARVYLPASVDVPADPPGLAERPGLPRGKSAPAEE